MMIRTLAVITALLAATTALAEPLPVVKQQGQQCPSGYSSGASYCTPMSGTRRHAIVKTGQCPSNWITSGGYCLSPPERR
jgi:hypothetical protein